jgi:enoyl-CoA hydratase
MTTSTPSPVLSDVRGEVGVLTLNRPEVRNALNLPLREALQESMGELDADPRVAVVVITGAGGNFCSGRDLKAAAAGEPMYRDRAAQQSAFPRTSIRKPVIAAIEGYALAGGFELALSCDLVVAARDARFGLPEVKRNLVAVGGALFRLPRRIPYHVAMELALTGDQVSAEQLASWGVVSRLADPGSALDTALELAGRITGNGPSAVRATKEIVRRSVGWTTESDAFDAQLAAAEPALSSPDRQEGIAAFLERRAPVWRDR